MNFMDVIYGASVKGNGEDKLCYRPNKKNGFIVSGYYWVLLGISDQLNLTYDTLTLTHARKFS